LRHDALTGTSVGAVFLGIFVEIWQAQPFAGPDDTPSTMPSQLTTPPGA
jgi:hypothetical protein